MRELPLEAMRYVTKADLVKVLEEIPDDFILYQSPVTSGLVFCERDGDDIDMSDHYLPWPDGRTVMTPSYIMRGLIQWYPDGRCGITERWDESTD